MNAIIKAICYGSSLVAMVCFTILGFYKSDIWFMPAAWAFLILFTMFMMDLDDYMQRKRDKR
jgi:uncharacterized membrane protein